MQQKPQIGIMGAGSIGCYLGAKLLSGNVPTRLIGRASLGQELTTQGLTVSLLDGSKLSISPAKVDFETQPEYLADCDVVLLTVKSTDTESACLSLQPVLKQGTVVVSFQNGVRNAARISQLLPQAQVIAGMVPFNVVKTGVGSFHNGTSGSLIIGQSPYAARVVTPFHQAQLAIDIHPDIQGVLWGKLIFNLNNAINALAGVPLREELSDKRYRRIVAAAMREALRVMKNGQIKPLRLGKMIPWLAPSILSLPDFLFFKVAAGMVKIDPQARSSMWEDLEKHRRTEIDYLNGEIVRLGQTHNMPTPVNSTIVALLRQAEEAQQGSPMLSADALWKQIQQKS